MTDETVLLSYDEIAERLGIARESARQLALRKRWHRQKGNDGKARIKVPLDALPSHGTSDAPSHDTSGSTGDETSVVTVLTRHIERLEAALATAEADRDMARDEARAGARDAARAREERAEAILAKTSAESRVEALQAALDAEKAIVAAEERRAADLQADRDRWADLAAGLQAQAARPWWKRLVG